MTFLVRRVAPLLLLCVLVGMVALRAIRPLGNPDTYFHLRFGAEFVSGWSLWDPGTVSSFATASWVPTQWLPQVVMAWVEDVFGLAGVAWLFGVLLLVLIGAMYWAARWRADLLATVGTLLVALTALNPYLSMRPQLISFILTAVAVRLWLRASDEGRTPWLLVPLTWLWAMSHGMWPLGIIIGVVAVAGLVLDRAHPRRTLIRLAAVPALSAVAAALTPVGPELYRAVLLVNSRGDYFPEWAPPDFTTQEGLAVLALAAVVLLAMLRHRNPWFEILLVGLALGYALYSTRTTAVAAVMLVPFAARAVQTVIGPVGSPSGREGRIVVGVLVAAAAVLAVLTPRTASQPLATPEWLEPRLSAMPAGTAILNDAGWGGFLMWAHPDLDPVLHGYGDTYTTAELDRFIAMIQLRPGWDETVDQVDAPYALLPPRSALGYALEEDGWTIVEESEELRLLAAP